MNAPLLSIPEPTTTVTDVSAFRFFEAPSVDTDKVALVPNYYSLEDLTATGTARPTKVSTGVGSVLLDGINNFLQSLSTSEYSNIHNGTTDWQMSFTYKAMTLYDSSSATLVGTGSTSNGFRIFASGISRIYGYAGGSDNSTFSTVNGDLWTTVTLCFDSSANDLYKFKNGVALSTDSNWAFSPITGAQHIALSFGIHPATSTKYECEWRDWRIAWELGNTTTDGLTYHDWANVNSLLT